MTTHPIAYDSKVPARPAPVRLLVDDDLFRSRLTIWLRLYLVVPHLLWLCCWATAAAFASWWMWLRVIATGRSSERLHRFLGRYVRYFVHVEAYLLLVADPFPSFTARTGYPIDLSIPLAARQNRASAVVRWLIALPATVLATGLIVGACGAAVAGWCVCVVLGRMPEGLRNFSAACLGYQAQTAAYVLLLTAAYPRFRTQDEDGSPLG